MYKGLGNGWILWHDQSTGFVQGFDGKARRKETTWKAKA
jgi:hypothetical protein